MRVNARQLPSGGGDDRVVITDNAVIMLDGASAFSPVPVSPYDYVDLLSDCIINMHDPNISLRTILRDAITETAAELDLHPGKSPSSTVTILREVDDRVECLVLGDNLVVLPGHVIIDDRINQIGVNQRDRYRQRLRAGHGYDGWHTQILRELQTEQAKHRNQPGGYWIAEANPTAAEHAITVEYPVDSAPWAVLATDGAYKTMTHLGLNDWSRLSNASTSDLEQLLKECAVWEGRRDPRGQELPRARCSDDKSLAVVTFGVNRA